MPVTIFPSPDKAGKNTDAIATSNAFLLQKTSINWIPSDTRDPQTGARLSPESRPILKSSFSDIDEGNVHLIPYPSGLVHGLIRAFEQDLHVIIRPDDVWMAILTQFGMYVNGHAEKLRRLFVLHDGKKNLVVDTGNESVWTYGIGRLAQDMTQTISKNVVDADLRDWIMPSFTTTTNADKSIASMLMMATMQPYFKYEFRGGCGFPSVKLLGERSDWEEILRRVERLPKYGAQSKQWSKLLIPVITRFVSTFDLPNSEDTNDFWLRACHATGQDGSGDVRSVSGWLTAFCFFDKYGKCIQGLQKNNYSATSWASRKPLELDGIEYPVISAERLPVGTMSVPVAVQDHLSKKKYKTTIVAGIVGMTLTTKDDSDTVQPRSGWWMLQDGVDDM